MFQSYEDRLQLITGLICKSWTNNVHIPQWRSIHAWKGIDYLYITEYVLLFLLFVLVCGTEVFNLYRSGLSALTEMGNEASNLPSEPTTPLTPPSEWQSVYSFGSKRRSSVSSTRLPTPVDPPEPDLSNLSEEEIKQIRSVLDRAKEMQHEEHKRIRTLEEDYISHAAIVDKRTPVEDPEVRDVTLCPLCLKNEILIDGPGNRKGQNVCVDCENLTCIECGSFEGSLNSRLQEWVCSVCRKRRKLVFSTGLWHPGTDTSDDIPLARELESRLHELKESTKAIPPLEKAASIDQPDTSSGSKPPLRRQMSLPTKPVQVQPVEHSLVPIKENEKILNTSEGSSAQESPLSDDYASLQPHHGKSRIRAMGHHSKSDSEMSDNASDDVDMEDVSMQYTRGDGISPDDVSDDVSMMSIGSTSGDDSGRLKRKHRPLSLHIPSSVSATSSDDETSDSNVSTDTESRLAPLARMDEERVALAASAFAEEMGEFKIESSENSWADLLDKSDSDTHDDHKSNLSPIAPRSPSWREGLESPPFSPRRKDSYPGKKRSNSPVSPKEARSQFTYNDLSPSSRQMFSEEIHNDKHFNKSHESFSNIVHKPFARSPDDSVLCNSGDYVYLEMPQREKHASELDYLDLDGDPKVVARIPESAACMNLATYAATIASNTANLTQMTVSPTNLQVHPGHDRELTVSPDSQSSGSPVSPGYYDNLSIPEEQKEEEDIELADPSSKPIDYQGTKRQKARPPSTDWSPVIDLSPILDVSPSIEEAEQEDMFIKQEEERKRRESQEEDESEGESKHFFQPVKEEDELNSYYGLKRYDRVEDICKLLDIPDSEFEIPKKENGIVEAVQNHINSTQESTELPFSCASVAQSAETNDKYSVLTVQSNIDGTMSVLSSQSSPKVVPIPITDDKLSSSVNKETEIVTHQRPKSAGSKSRRKLPEPTPEMIAAHVKKQSSKSLPPPLPPPKLEKTDSTDGQKGRDYATIIIPEKKLTSAVSKSVQKHKQKDKQQSDQISTKDPVQKQDSDERRRKAKDMKAKPNPIVIQHIDSEDQSMSPQYKVLDSPPSPESRSSLKRDYSDSTSVSPSSSPDRDLYAYPSPVTPPDSDSSPPKPHSPSSPGTDFDEEGITLNHITNLDDEEDQDPCKVEGRVKDRIKKYEQATSADQRKVRRKLPPLPQEEQSVSPTHVQQTKIKPHNVQRKQPLKPDPRRHRAGYTTPSSTSDDSMNEEDKEVAMLTKQRRINDLDKPSLDRWNGNYLPADVSDLKVMKNVKQMYNEDVKANIPPDNNHKMAVSDRKLDQFLKNRDETDQIIDSMINIYGVPITQAMKSLKRRLQEELRRVTEGRRRRIEEIEEIRALQRQIGELKLGQEYAKVQAKRNSAAQKHAKGSGQNGKKRNSVPLTAPRSSPQVIPRRARHKRQSSDPMVSKFSPIKEDKDTEADFQFKAKAEEEEAMAKYVTDDSSQSGLSDNDSTRSEPTTNARYKKIKPSAYASMFYNQSPQERRRKSPNLDTSDGAKMHPKSHSESHIPQKVKDKSSTYYSDDDEKKAREQRKLQLQNEIERRKRQLEETTKLQTELFNLSRPSHIMAHSYDDIPRKSTRTFPSTRPIPTGIIKPLEDEDYDDVSDDREFVTRSYQEISKPAVNSSEASYSSTEYLAHKQESTRRSRFDEPTSYSNPYLYVGNINDPRACKPTKQKVDFYLDPSSRDAHITSSVTLPELHTSRADMDFPPNKDHVALSDTETSPPSDSTPAMPLLDDVTARSRKIIHEIGTGSRPVSAEFSFNILGSEDLLNGMYRVESDNSVDADEPIMKHLMEGGVTILKQLERKKQPPPHLPKSYDFPTKKILLTPGNGLGMKIIGGRTIPGTSTVGAYVATIYPGGIADQLHGELREGDQILEWNGIELSDKSYEEVQRVIGQPNGEIELLVRPRNREADDKEKGGSCHSSYDNIDFVADEVYEKCLKSNHGVDPNQLAAQLEGIKETDSPAGSQSSSQHEFLTPSVSSPCSSPRSDHASSSSDRQRHAVNIDTIDRADKLNFPKLYTFQSTQQEPRDWGEIQLQLNHDEYDSSLLIHVAQARNLRPKDINGLSDPFVKIYLLPGRCAENKRRTKHISRTLNPEWHQTVMFSDIHKEEIKYKTLEITVWDYDRFKANDFLGEVVIDLSVPGFLDDQPHWYPLQEHDQTRGVELPKPTVLPPSVRIEEDRRRICSPSLLKSARDSPNMQRRRVSSNQQCHRKEREREREKERDILFKFRNIMNRLKMAF
ncbi:hypothetical protein FSP39_018967 [Pinctada imbricata]|uniref:Protein piccolo n=1 Tax=Pinctada imbricata TaxID=66713 RepID=A0AA88YQ34_PINIB|nr:hypothetical protein FSP39_018967 [Pinctada imbricata]